MKSLSSICDIPPLTISLELIILTFLLITTSSWSTAKEFDNDEMIIDMDQNSMDYYDDQLHVVEEGDPPINPIRIDLVAKESQNEADIRDNKSDIVSEPSSTPSSQATSQGNKTRQPQVRPNLLANIKSWISEHLLGSEPSPQQRSLYIWSLTNQLGHCINFATCRLAHLISSNAPVLVRQPLDIITSYMSNQFERLAFIEAWMSGYRLSDCDQKYSSACEFEVL